MDRGELAGLHELVDLGPADAEGVTGGLLFVEPKSEKGRRTIGIPSQLVVALRAHRQAQPEERMAAGSLWQDHGLVFSSLTGGKIDPRRDWAQWKAMMQAAGVHDARLHDARHTAATLPLSQISLTQNTYQHVMPKMIADAT